MYESFYQSHEMNRYWLILLLPIALLLWWGLDRDGSGPQIHFDTAGRMTIESTVSTNGIAEPAEWAAARAESAGVVRAVDVQRGDNVVKGQPLVDLDTAAEQSALAAALASEQEARADLASLSHGGKAAALADVNDKIKSAQAALQVAERNCASTQRLYASQAATKVQLQDAQDKVHTASLQLSALEDQRKTLATASEKTVAEAKLRDAQAAVDLARHKIRLGSVRAPISGTVYQFDLKVGAYLQPGTLVAKIGKLDQVKVTVYIDEPDLGRVAKGMPVLITWDALPDRTWTGQVKKLPTEITALGTRTVGKVTTIVDNPRHDLLPGVSINAVIISQVAKNALAVPKAALRTLNGRQGVYKLVGDHLSWTPVKAGVSDINDVQILSGLQSGDRVADRVVSPSDAEMKNGMRVRPVFG
ncbi:MAG TPA: efflux RND transporter periplasmic adaptor subunit [Bryobacteraceae bacterium]